LAFPENYPMARFQFVGSGSAFGFVVHL